MKNANFKNAVISGVMAIFLGVLLLGANAVFGATPTLNPPGSGVSPTFTGLTVTGTSNLQNISASGNASIDGSTSSKTITARTGLTVQDGQLYISSSTVTPIVVWVLNTAGNALTVQDSTHADKFTIKINNGMAELYFADNGQIKSKDDNHRILFRRTENKMELREYGDIVFSPGSTAGAETAKVTMKSDGTVNITNNLSVSGASLFGGNSTFGGNVDVLKKMANSQGDLTIDDNANITGHLIVASIGKYTLQPGTAVYPAAGNGGMASTTCSGYGQILSCQAIGGSNLAISHTGITDNNCYVIGRNEGTFAQILQAQAMCFDSAK